MKIHPRLPVLLFCGAVLGSAAACDDDSKPRPDADGDVLTDPADTPDVFPDTDAGEDGDPPVEDTPDADAGEDVEEEDGPPASPFPVRVSDDGRTLVDSAGRPFLMHGEAAWSIIVQLTLEETDLYAADRQARGINVAMVNLIEHHFCDDPPRNAAGDDPFLTPGDFGEPNEAYFAHADAVLERLRDAGILVLLFPAYMGWGGGGEGWFVEMEALTAETCRAYGDWLGDRYGALDNIVWMAGGDYAPPTGSDGERCGLEIAAGLRERDPDALHSTHWARNSTSLDLEAFHDYVDLDGVYTAELTHGLCLEARAADPGRPHYLIEAIYENEHDIQPPALRAQAWWAVLTCGAGQLTGTTPIWPFSAGWEEALDSTLSRQMVHLRALLEPRRWHLLDPDTDHTLVVSGYGGDTDLITAARTADGLFALAYVPSTGTDARTFSVDMGAMAGAVTARWFNPTDGSFADVEGSPFDDGAAHDLATPGDNGTGSNDWTLVLESSP